VAALPAPLTAGSGVTAKLRFALSLFNASDMDKSANEFCICDRGISRLAVRWRTQLFNNDEYFYLSAYL